jgi:hypothetical protein
VDQQAGRLHAHAQKLTVMIAIRKPVGNGTIPAGILG